MMDADKASEIINPPQIVIEHPAEIYSVKDVALEQIARLLAKADGKNPDADCRVQGGVMLAVYIEYPANLVWYTYRDKAEELLRQAFKASK